MFIKNENINPRTTLFCFLVRNEIDVMETHPETGITEDTILENCTFVQLETVRKICGFPSLSIFLNAIEERAKAKQYAVDNRIFEIKTPKYFL
jgi:hypothetical protein